MSDDVDLTRRRRTRMYRSRAVLAGLSAGALATLTGLIALGNPAPSADASATTPDATATGRSGTVTPTPSYGTDSGWQSDPGWSSDTAPVDPFGPQGTVDPGFGGGATRSGGS
jgi:hypothetical protein